MLQCWYTAYDNSYNDNIIDQTGKQVKLLFTKQVVASIPNTTKHFRCANKNACQTSHTQKT